MKPLSPLLGVLLSLGAAAFLASWSFAALPPQRMSPAPIPQVVIQPQSAHTNLGLYWAQNYDPTYLWTEVWHSSDLVNWNIYPICPGTNYVLVPMNNWFTNVSPLYDTNSNFIGWQTNPVNADFFFTVDVEMWSVRITNQTWTFRP